MKRIRNNPGQAFITLVLFVAIAMSVISGTIIIIVVNSFGASLSEKSILVHQSAENGIENALVHLLRDPDYAGETLSPIINSYNTVISVTGNDNNKTIVSTASSSNITKAITAKIFYNNNVMTVTYWQDSQ